jgi:hypothetical protein
MADRIKEVGGVGELLEFPGHHAFLGFPIEWTLNQWQVNTWPAYNAMVDFIAGEQDSIVVAKDWPRDLSFDWTVVMTGIIALVCFPLYGPFMLVVGVVKAGLAFSSVVH